MTNVSAGIVKFDINDSGKENIIVTYSCNTQLQGNLEIYDLNGEIITTPIICGVNSLNESYTKSSLPYKELSMVLDLRTSSPTCLQNCFSQKSFINSQKQDLSQVQIPDNNIFLSIIIILSIFLIVDLKKKN